MTKSKTLLLITIIMLFTSCSYIEQYVKERESEGVIAIIGDNYLYKDEIKDIVPQGTNSADSALIVDAYIRRWATNILILDNAKRNISNQAEINKMVENYRRTLTIHYYKQDMVNEKIKMPTDEETIIFYNNNKELFLLDQPIIKGALIKIPNNVKSETIERKFKDINNNIEDIEKYALQYAKDYTLFTEYWKPLNEVINFEKTNLKITKPGYYAERDSINLTLINVIEYINQGEVAPIEMIKEEVKSTLYNQQKKEYLDNFDDEIYDYAIKHNQIQLKIEN